MRFAPPDVLFRFVIAATLLIPSAIEAQEAVTINAAAPAAPYVEFKDDAVSLRGTRGGNTVVWMALVRKRVYNRVVVSVDRGIVHAAADGEARISAPAARERRAVWNITTLEDGASVIATPPGYEGRSQLAVDAEVQAGNTSVRVEAPEIHLLYVRPPAGVWFFDAADGSATDGDGTQNGTIVVPLSALERLETGPKPPPDDVRSGDFLLLLDSRRVRSTKVVVP